MYKNMKNPNAGKNPLAISCLLAMLFLLLVFSFVMASCSQPYLALLNFNAGPFSSLTVSGASIGYSWAFTELSSPGGKAFLTVKARLYKDLGGGSRILVAEKTIELKSKSGSDTLVFNANLSSGKYYAEFAYVDELGPKVITTTGANLP